MSSGSSNFRSNSGGWLRCNCKEPTTLIISWTDDNPRRRFYGCRLWSPHGDDCKYFDWYDLPMCDRSVVVIPQLRRKNLKTKEENEKLVMEKSKMNVENAKLIMNTSKLKEENAKLMMEMSKMKEENTKLVMKKRLEAEHRCLLEQAIEILKREKKGLEAEKESFKGVYEVLKKAMVVLFALFLVWLK